MRPQVKGYVRTNTGEPLAFRHFFFYAVILMALVFQGGYYLPVLLILNMVLILWLLVDRRPVKPDVSLACMLLLFAVMAFNALFRSADGYSAIHELLKYSLFPLSYAVFSSLREDRRLEAIFRHAFLLLALAGLAAVMGYSLFAGMVTIQGNRLQSFLQYANTTALLVGAGALLSLDRWIATRNKWQAAWFVLFLAALVLTQSRTTFVLFVLVLLMYAGSRLQVRARWAALVGIVGAAGAVLFLVGGRLARISLFEPTLVERLITFHDAWRIVFWETGGLGLGPGSWQYMQFAYQSAPYQVRYVHNFFLQAAVDGGILALLLLAGWMAFHLVKGWKSRGIYYFLLLFVILHSLFEVDFQFGIVILFFTFVLTRLHPPVPLPACKLIHRIKSWAVPGLLSGRLRYRWLLVLPLVLLAAALVSEMFASRAAALVRADPPEAKRMYEAALKWNPLNRGVLYELARMERNPDHAIAYLEKSLERNPHDFRVLKSLSDGYLYKMDFEQSYHYAERLFRVFPYSRQNQEQVRKVLKFFLENHTIGKGFHDNYLLDLDVMIQELDQRIHPLYRHIHPEMNY
jgi:O-antigen ligase